MPRFFFGDLLTGRRIQNLNVTTGSWKATLNAAGEVSCTVSLRDPDMRGLGLFDAAVVGKSFLAVAEGNSILQAGPIWTHNYQRDAQTLSFVAAGMWSYFDHRVLLPVLAGRLPTDPTTNTRWTNTADDWPTDTSKSYQGMVRDLVAQAQSWTGGNVPVILPAEIAGSKERNYIGSDVAFVGERLSQLNQLDGGPDIRFDARFTSDMQGVEWPLLIGTPTQPMLFSPIDAVFKVSAEQSSVTGLSVKTDGTSLASQAFASGGRQAGDAIVNVATDPFLTDAGWPLLETVDSGHQTVSETDTLQSYADEAVLRGKRPIRTWSFTHDVSIEPFMGTLNPGDFARARIHDDPYIPDGEYRMRVVELGSDEKGRKLALTFQAEVN